MAQEPDAVLKPETLVKASWLPMAIILLAQIQISFNTNTLRVSIGAIVEDLDAPATSIGTALVVHSLFIAAFVMLGAKLGKRFGERLVFQAAVLVHGFAMAVMAVSMDAAMMNNAQAIAGLSAAVMVPTLVVLIVANYHGGQQEKALGLLAGAGSVAGVLAFVIAGFLATVLSWRYSYIGLFFLSIGVFVLSFRLKPMQRQSDLKIDVVGAVIAALAIILISVSFNNLNDWGVFFANPGAPFSLFGLSPAPFFIVIGLVLGQAFFTWSNKRETDNKAPLLSSEVLNSRYKRASIYCMLVISAVAAAVNFLIPLYIQIVQGRTSLQTAVSVVPYLLAVTVAAVTVVRFYGMLSPRMIGAVGFCLVCAGSALLAFSIRNVWGTPSVIFSLVVLGLGEGMLITLLFNVLVSSSPKSLAGDVGALRGATNNLASAVGTALAATLSVGVLSFFVLGSLADSQSLPTVLLEQVNLDNINFISNDQLLQKLSDTTATPEQIEEAVRINIEARLRALKASFLILAAIALLAIFPALGLPGHAPGELSDSQTEADPLVQVS